jgi:hypothetical protein
MGEAPSEWFREGHIVYSMSPEFPIRIITDDGECEVIESPEELMARVDSIDSDDPRIWVRDANDRTVTLKMRNGIIEVLE